MDNEFEKNLEIKNDDLTNNLNPLEEQKVDENAKDDSLANEISELSKKGYALLKEDKTDDAIAAFNQILSLEDNNN